VGLLSGNDVHVRFRPAQADTGIVFVRADLPERPRVPAHVRHVVPRQRRTSIQRGEAVVEMVEHAMAALSGLKIDNCLVEVDAPEMPGCDGSSLAFTRVLQDAGIVEQSEPRPALVIERPVTVRNGEASLTAFPGGGEGLVVTYNLDYRHHSPIGRQSLFLEITPEVFREELAPSRTFLLEAEARAMVQAGIGTRTTPRDLLVFGPHGPIENELRFPDECVRHKMLDVVGDLALLGLDIAGHVVAHRSGHHLNADLVRKLHEAVEKGEEEGEADESGPEPRAKPPERAMDIGEIMKILPHRYPFLLVDRVLNLELGRRILAIKNVSCNEPFFLGHWPDRPIMPGVLIIEALAQAAGVLLAHWFDPRSHLGLMASIDEVKMRRPVVPGDQLQLEATVLRNRRRMADFQARATVDGELAAEAQIRFVIVPR
jgi:UDP-3-O-[3-hydroxymyristoyl] N-acetylglucosamine deacetylase/3-hydroxyacyl-[acyl-carrier-protein] dehydratase